VFVSLDVIKFPKKIGKPFGDLPKNMYLCRRKLKVNMSTYKTYLEFIRYALNPKGERPKDVAKMDWDGFFQFADEQAILGMMYDGRKQMADESGMRDEEGFMDDLTLEWGFEAQQIKEQNEAINRKCVEVQKELQEAGFQCCILKGQGNSLLYPKPYRRMPGDIDVWVRMDDGRCKMEDGRGKRDDVKEVIRFVKERNPEARAVYHHIDGGEIDDIEVEVHYKPSFMNNLIHNRRLQKWFEQKAPEQFGHKVELPDGAGEICTPTTDFNTVYLLAHIYRHLMQEGIGLRQIIDYYYVLMEDVRWKMEDVSDTLRSLGLWKIAGAVMWVLNEVLGLEEKYLIAPKDERLGKVLLAEIVNGGNFGQYDSDNIKADNQLKKNWQRICRDFRLMRYFPSECLWEPVFRIYHFFWRLRYN
jgi:hypothetical protein